MQQIHRWTLRQSSFVLKCSFKDKNVSCAYKGTETREQDFGRIPQITLEPQLRARATVDSIETEQTLCLFFFSVKIVKKKKKKKYQFINRVSERGIFARMIGATQQKTCSQSVNFAQSVLLNRIKLKNASLVGLFHNPYLTN